MDFNNLTTTMQGNIGLGAAIAYFTSINLVVSLPLNDNQSYDLVIDINGDLKKIQVKTTGYKRDKNFSVQLKTVRPNRTGFKTCLFDNTKSDYIFVYTENRDLYLIPSKDIKTKYEIALGEKYSKFKLTYGESPW